MDKKDIRIFQGTLIAIAILLAANLWVIHNGFADTEDRLSDIDDILGSIEFQLAD